MIRYDIIVPLKKKSRSAHKRNSGTTYADNTCVRGCVLRLCFVSLFVFVLCVLCVCCAKAEYTREIRSGRPYRAPDVDGLCDDGAGSEEWQDRIKVRTGIKENTPTKRRKSALLLLLLLLLYALPACCVVQRAGGSIFVVCCLLSILDASLALFGMCWAQVAAAAAAAATGGQSVTQEQGQRSLFFFFCFVFSFSAVM